MVGWREYFLVLGFFGKLGRKDLAFDVTVGFDIGDWKSYALVHHFSVEVLALDLFLAFT